MKKALFLSLAASVLTVSAVAHAFDKGPLKIDHPWSRETAAQASTGAGFLSIQNYGKTPDRLVAIKSSISDDVQVHTMTMEGGVMRMRELKNGLTIPPGGEVKLQPGAEHIMFMGLKGPIKLGEDFTATLVFERAGEVEVTFKVEPAGAKPAAGHQH